MPTATATRLIRFFFPLFAVFAANIASAAGPTPPEASLRDELQGARWPADIVAAAGRYQSAYPQGPQAEAARSDFDRARNTKRLLERSDIRLYRADFAGSGASQAATDDMRKAALGDKEAALRLAHLHRDGDATVKADVGHYIGWLQYSAALGNAAGSYELALYYRKDNQPALAAPYEARAEELGFKVPPALDNVRK